MGEDATFADGEATRVAAALAQCWRRDGEDAGEVTGASARRGASAGDVGIVRVAWCQGAGRVGGTRASVDLPGRQLGEDDVVLVVRPRMS